MTYATGDDNLSKFLAMSRKTIQKTRGINEQSLRQLANLAAKLQLSAEEMDAAGAQLGLSNTEVQQVIDDGQLTSEAGGGSAVGWVLALGSLALLLGVGGGIAYYLMNQRTGDNQQQQVAQNDDNKDKQTTKYAEIGGKDNNAGDGKNTPSNGGPNKPVNAGKPPTPPTPVAVAFPDEEVLFPIAALQVRLPGEIRILEQLKSDDATKRAEAWNQLLPKLPGFMTQKELMKALLISAHAKENSENNAQAIREQLLKLLPPSTAVLPDNASSYDNAFWAAEVAAEALQHPALPAARKEKLQQELEKALQTKLGAGQPVAEMKKQCGKALSELFYGQLIKSAHVEPDKAAKLEVSLAAQTLAYLGINQGDLAGKLRQAISEAKAPAAPPPGTDPNPKPFEPAPTPKPPTDERLGKLTNTADVLLKKTQPVTGDPIKVLQDTVNLAYTTTLAVALASKQQAKFDELAGSPPNLSEYLAKVKPPEKPKQPDAPPPPNPADNPPPNPGGFPPPNPGGFPPPGFPGGAGAVGFMGGPGNPPPGFPGGGAIGVPGGGFAGFMGGPNPVPGGAGGIVGVPGGPGVPGGAVGFMGGPLPPGGAAGFGAIGNPGVVGFSGAAGNPGPGAVGFGGAIGNPGGVGGIVGIPPGGGSGVPGAILGNPGGMPGAGADPATQMSPLEHLAMALKQIKSNNAQKRYEGLGFVAQGCKQPDLNPHEAEIVAEYLLGMTNPQEFEAAVPLLSSLGRYKGLNLALADLVGDANILTKRMELIVSTLTGKQAGLGKQKDWRKQAKAVLLQHALSMAEGVPEGDAVQLLLRDLYQKQAALLGLELPASMTTTSAILERLIEHLTDQLNKKPDGSDAAKKFLKGIPGQLVAAKFVSGSNDIQKTVLLQRLWLDVLGEKLALEQPAKAKQARELCLDLDAKCRQQADALTQMWLCDQYLLRMWLLHLEQPAQTAKKN